MHLLGAYGVARFTSKDTPPDAILTVNGNGEGGRI
jgi:hypothetical protein